MKVDRINFRATVEEKSRQGHGSLLRREMKGREASTIGDIWVGTFGKQPPCLLHVAIQRGVVEWRPAFRIYRGHAAHPSPPTPSRKLSVHLPCERGLLAWLNVLGLALDVIGAAILSYGLFLNKTEAIELGVSRLSGETQEENVQLPAVRDRLRQSRNAKIGLCFLVTGFALQMASTWP